nr:hypothetical protein [Micromonospora haikouensis]
MEIIDAHLHLPRTQRPWDHGDESFLDLQGELLVAQLDAAGVDVAVLVSHPLFAQGWGVKRPWRGIPTGSPRCCSWTRPPGTSPSRWRGSGRGRGSWACG